MSECHNNRRGCTYPLLHDPDKMFVAPCKPHCGPTVTIGVPQYHLDVANIPDLIWRDDNYLLVQENNGELLILDNVF